MSKMKTIVIHPEDSTTDFLSDIYIDKDWTIINKNASKKILKESIKKHDRVIMLGHGTEKGLIGFDHFIIDSSYVYLLKDKICICIWCNADKFVEKYKLKGFYTGMIISEFDEAYLFNIPASYELLQESNKDFASALKMAIDSGSILKVVLENYDGNLPLIKFNKSNLYENIS
jgi:hypothetical protein